MAELLDFQSDKAEMAKASEHPPALDWIWRIALLGALLLIAYWPALHSGFIWDDDRYVENNRQLQSFLGLLRIWFDPHASDQYYPMTYTSFWIEHHIWQNAAAGFHIVNLAIHCFSAILLWRILRRLAVPGAYFVALLFALHPVQVESVAWITERKNVLATFFYFLSLTTYLSTKWGAEILGEIVPTDENLETTRPKRRWYILSLLFFAAAILSKSVTCTLPAVILLLGWWKLGRVSLRQIRPLLPMFIAGLLMGRLTSWLEMNWVGAVGPGFDFTPMERICIAGRNAWFYLSKLLWPHNLIFIYPRWQYQLAGRPWQILFPITMAGLLLGLWMLRNRIGRGPLTALLFFLGTLLPALGFFNVYPMKFSFVADHFQYLALLGPLTLIVGILSVRLARPLAVALFLLQACAMTLADSRQSRIYFDRATLWSSIIRANPKCEIAHQNYGLGLYLKGDLNGAEAEYQTAMMIDPNNPENYLDLGNVAGARGHWMEAIDWHTRAIAMEPSSSEEPVLKRQAADPYFRRGSAWAMLSDHEASAGQTDLAYQHRQNAERDFHQAIQLIPDYELALTNLAAMLAQDGQLKEAAELLHHALEVDPDSISAHHNLGSVLMRAGLLEQAMHEFSEMLRINPNSAEALDGIGSVYALGSDYFRAAQCFRASLSIDPNNQLARHHLEMLTAGMSATSRP